MKISTLFFPAILFSLIVGFGLRADYPNLPKRVSSGSAPINKLTPITGIVPVDAVSSMIRQVNQDRIISDLSKLTGVEPVCLDHGCYTITDRSTGSTGLQWAKDFIFDELTSLGYSVEIHDWSSGELSDQDFIIRKQGTISPENEMYFLAHMDGVDNSPAADDDASGVVSLLELARILNNRSFSNTIVLLFTSGEEQGTLGVSSYLESLSSQQLGAIKYVVNVDMISYDANEDKRMELFNGGQPEDFVQSLIEIISIYHIGLTPQIYSDCG